jgi:hypothetical protein
MCLVSANVCFTQNFLMHVTKLYLQRNPYLMYLWEISLHLQGQKSAKHETSWLGNKPSSWDTSYIGFRAALSNAAPAIYFSGALRKHII